MHNPFSLLSHELLDALVQAGHQYFVRQTYRRGLDHFDAGVRAAFLISHYTDKSKAQIHYKSLSSDPHRFLYDIEAPGHLEKLRIAAGQPEGYRIYSPLLQREWKPSGMMAQKIRNYIDDQLHWKPGKKQGVKTDLFLQFGELFITLKWKTTEVKIPLAEIERY